MTSKTTKWIYRAIPGAYHMVAGHLPVEEATGVQLKQSAKIALGRLNPEPDYLSNLLDHGKERLTRIVRLLCTQVSPTMNHVLSLQEEDAIKVWQMPKHDAMHLLFDPNMKFDMEEFYKNVRTYYPDETSVEAALSLIKNGVLFLKVVQDWYKKMKIYVTDVREPIL